MPLLEDFVKVHTNEDWECGPNNKSSKNDKCNFLNFQASKQASTTKAKMKNEGTTIRMGGWNNSLKTRKRKSKPVSEEDSVASNSSTEDETPKTTPIKKSQTIDANQHQTRLQKNKNLESGKQSETGPLSPGVCLRQRTQVFHYYQPESNLRSHVSLVQTNETAQEETSSDESHINSLVNGKNVVKPGPVISLPIMEKEIVGSPLIPSKPKSINGKSPNKSSKIESIGSPLRSQPKSINGESSKKESEEETKKVSKKLPKTNVENKIKKMLKEDLTKILKNGDSMEIETETNVGSQEKTPTQTPSTSSTPSRSRPIRKSNHKMRRLVAAEKSTTDDGGIWYSVSRSPSPVNNEPVETNDSSNGVIVWAKLAKFPWWPAIIFSGEECSRNPAEEGTQWIFWLGDYKISKLPTSQMVEFVTNYNSKINEKGNKQYVRSVIEALTVCASRSGVKISPDDHDGLFQWAKDGFYNQHSNGFPFAPDPRDPIPEFIRRRQDKLKVTTGSSNDKSPCDSANNSTISSGRGFIPNAIEKVKAGQIKITEMCLACGFLDAKVVVLHPVFEGGLCKNCQEEIKETVYAIGEDGTSSYCAVCGSPGELIICDHPGCSKVYCSGCVKSYAAEGELEKIMDAETWICYFCRPFDPKVHGHLRKTENWERNIIQLFHAESHANIYPEQSFSKKRPIRVLSLFDGIGTGRLVLDLLNIEVEVYYSSEIDVDSILVSSVRHKMTHLGNVERISDVEIAKLCPFDLLIGGSPCNDLSLVNPIRKGLYDPCGTGKLFFDFYRILKVIQLNNKNNHLFWLYENVASMPHEYRNIISRFLQCEPSLIDSKHFSPQNRARYYWGNIPGLYSSIPTHLTEQEITLQSILTPNCNRKALVEKVRCITTRSNSLVQKGGGYPVEMDGKADSLWINELEKAFGFPEHHTDIGNLSFNRRQHLLGRAWTVPVIEYILKPLRNFFKLNGETTDEDTITPTLNGTTSHSAKISTPSHSAKIGTPSHNAKNGWSSSSSSSSSSSMEI